MNSLDLDDLLRLGERQGLGGGPQPWYVVVRLWYAQASIRSARNHPRGTLCYACGTAGGGPWYAVVRMWYALILPTHHPSSSLPLTLLQLAQVMNAMA